jgi:molecular chaperone HscA
VSDCRSLGRFELHGIPPMTAGAARIRVTFQVDADGLLEVSAQELATGAHSGITVKPSYGLSDREIETMLRDSIDHAGEDMDARRLREQQVEADRVLEALSSALAVDGDALLEPAERAAIDAALARLRELRLGGDHLAIRRGVEALERTCAGYVERRMNSNIRSALSGHRVEEFGDPEPAATKNPQ